MTTHRIICEGSCDPPAVLGTVELPDDASERQIMLATLRAGICSSCHEEWETRRQSDPYASPIRREEP